MLSRPLPNVTLPFRFSSCSSSTQVWAALEGGDQANGQALIGQLIEGHSTCAETHYALGTLAMVMNQPAEAESGFGRAIGLDPRAGEGSRVETASGVVQARVVMLRSVDIGGIRVENVRASVLEGAHPATILLGMSYLRHVDIHENDGVLSLSKAY